jgi:GAF domain-containing protein/DNA-binding CsgD family transcriptional regulator
MTAVTARAATGPAVAPPGNGVSAGRIRSRNSRATTSSKEVTERMSICELETSVRGDDEGLSLLGELPQADVAGGSDLDLEVTLRRIIEAGVSVADARYGAVGVIDQSGSGLAHFVTHGVCGDTDRATGPAPEGAGLLGSLIADAGPLRLVDRAEPPSSVGFPAGHPPTTSFLGVPIRVGAEVFGGLYLIDKITGAAFSDADEEFALGLAGAAGLAIENARRFEKAQRQQAALAAAHEVAAEFAAGTGRLAGLQLLARRARDLVGADLATIALPESCGDIMVIEAADGPHAPTWAGQRFSRAGSVAGDVLRSGHTVVLDDASVDHRVAQPPGRHGQIGPSVFVAMTVDGQPFATLSIGRGKGAAGFTPTEMDLVTTFAAHASVVAFHHEQTRHQRARLTLLEDQARSARELHDTIIERLFVASRSLRQASGQSTGAARNRVEDTVNELDDVIRTIRSVIFDGHTPHPDRGLRRPSLDVGPEIAPAISAESGIAFNGPLHTDITAIAQELLATLQEALTEVAHPDDRSEPEPDARLATAPGDPQVPALLDTLEHAHMARERVQRGLLGALVAFDHNVDTAFAALRQALLTPRPDGLSPPTHEPASPLPGPETSSPPETAGAGADTPVTAADATLEPWRHSPVTSLVEQLSTREVAVLEYLPSCLTNREIAAELFVSKNTVKAHEKSIYRKLGVNSRRQAVNIARTFQLI